MGTPRAAHSHTRRPGYLGGRSTALIALPHISSIARVRRVGGAAALAALALLAQAAAAPDAATWRDALSLNGEWRIKFDEAGDAQYGSWQETDFADQDWKRVAVPHTWSTMAGRETYRGEAWYRRSFRVPPAFQGKSVALKFQCVANRVKVWLNGEEVGAQAGGFVPFELDVTSALRPYKQNVLAVRCDNSAEEAKSDLWPWGGLIGDVWLEAAARTHVGQIAVRTSLVGRAQAIVDATVDVRHSGQAAFKGELALYLAEPIEGSAGWRRVAQQPLAIDPDGHTQVDLAFALDRPKLWSFDTPRLYRLRAVVRDAAGDALDTLDDGFGVRTVQVSGHRLLLNGDWVRIVGMGRFADHPSAGPFESAQAIAEDLDRVQAMNGVALKIRGAAPHPRVVEACDQRGILLTASLPLSWPDAELLLDPDAQKRIRTALLHMIRTYGNHPSIWSWSLGEGIPDDDLEVAAFMKQLHDLARALDPTRPVTYTSASPGHAAGLMDYVSVGGFFGADRRKPVAADAVAQAHDAWPDKMIVVDGWGGYNDGAAATTTAVARAIERDLADLRQRPYVGGLLWGALSHYRSTREREAGYDKKQQLVRAGLLTRGRKPTALAARIADAFAPATAPGLAYRSDTFAAGEKLALLVGLRVQSPAASRLPCYGLKSYRLRWGAGPAGELKEPTEERLVPPFEPDYFADGPRSVAWMQMSWTPGEDMQRVFVRVQRPTGVACAQRDARLRCLPAKGHAKLDRAMVIADLSAYFNNDGISSAADRRSGNFDAPRVALGGSYPAAELPASNSVFMSVAKDTPAVPFLFPDHDAAANNISCRGQMVIVPRGRYRRVHLLGSADNGDYEREVQLVYLDGPAETTLLGLTDWCADAQYGEAPVVRSQTRHGLSGQVEDMPCFIRRQSLAVDPARVLRAIRLPDEEHMHVFALTLEME